MLALGGKPRGLFFVVGMLFLIAVIVAVCIAIFLKTPLKKCQIAFYLTAVIISAAVSIFDFRGAPDFVNNYIIALFSRGVLATGLWAVVMWTGALPNGSKPIKALMPIRGELSIFAALLTLGHNIGFGKTYFVRMFTAPGSMSSQQLAAGMISIIMLLIMLPLTVMSFPKIRKKIKPKTWKNIQRSAYAFYALIYTHVMILNIPFALAGRSGYLLNVAVYSVIFIGYAACRIRKQIVLKKKPEKKAALNFCSAVASVVLCAVLVTVAIPKTNSAKPNSISTSTENSSVETPHNLASGSTVQISSSDTQTISSSSISSPPLPVESILQSTDSESIPESSSTVEPTQSDSQIESTSSSPQISSSKEPEPIPEPEYVYNNGVYTASAFGYDGDISVTITIENDKIISIKADSEESDLWYFDSAVDTVISRIISAQNTAGDAVSGATFSSKGIMSAVADALASAKRQ